MANPENPPKIDWAYYKSRIPVAGMVDDFQKKYEAYNIPVPQDTVGSQIDAAEKAAAARVKQFIGESNKRIQEYEAEKAKLESSLPFEQMTMEDFAYAFPHLALDPINKPTFWPHTEDVNPREEKPEGGH